MKKIIISLILVFILFFAGLNIVSARTLYVKKDTSNIWQDKSLVYNTISAAINAAYSSSGDTIWVAKGTFVENIVLKVQDMVDEFKNRIGKIFGQEKKVINEKNDIDIKNFEKEMVI